MNTNENTKIGEKIKFGSLNNEKIEWQILSVKENKALIITTEGIDSKLYNAQAIETNWESCSLRKWLNESFLADCFTNEEVAQIETTLLPWEENPSYSHKEGKATQDKIFLLSIAEAENYFNNNESRTCKPSSMAINHDVYVDEASGNCMWWLRNNGSALECAALVNENGEIDHRGDGVYCEGNAVRPAMWITLS